MPKKNAVSISSTKSSNELNDTIVVTTEISHEEPVDNSEGHGKTVREENPALL